jgi:PPM family protein phosphatase
MTTDRASSAATHVGCIREKNEDRYFTSDELGLYVLADGMGGHPRGEEASQFAVDSVVEFITGSLRSTPDLPLEYIVSESIQAAHQALCRLNEGAEQPQAMGTTLSVLLLREQQFAFGNAGDSRAYWISPSANDLVQLSRDDTVAAKLILRGVPPHLITRSQGRTLTQAVGISRTIQPHAVTGEVSRGEAILMCSDGLTDYVPADVLRSLVMSLVDKPSELIDALISQALSGGGGDNCTCIYVLRRPE